MFIAYALSLNTCNVLSLSGGGSFSAVEAGIVKNLIDKKEIANEFDIITGISAGGLNAAFLSYSANISNSIDNLIDIYETLSTEDIYIKNHPFEIFKSWGYYDTTPLENTIVNIISEQKKYSKIPVTLIGASNINLQQLDIFRYDTLSFNSQVDVLMATSAIPFLFPPKNIGKYTYIDGGSIDNEIIYQAMGQKDCDFYNYVFVSASDKSVDSSEIKSFVGYIKSVVGLVVDTFDYELAGLKNITCINPRGTIKACLPDSKMLSKYSILDFDNGAELVNIGMNNYKCENITLC